MNLTLSLLVGLMLLLPGIAAVAAWNHGTPGEVARRPELQLTSITALFAVLVVSLCSHLVTHYATNVILKALVEYGELRGRVLGSVWPDPYVAAFKFALGAFPVTPTETDVRTAIEHVGAFLALVLLQAWLAFMIVRNDGLDIVFNPVDLRSQGWAFQHVVLPGRHSFIPYARVFTNLASGDRGVGYAGIIADLRQGADGEVKVICLAEPKRFTYELRESKPKRWLQHPDFVMYPGEPADDAVTIDGASIRNITISHIDEIDADEVLDEDDGPEDAGNPEKAEPEEDHALQGTA